MTNIKEMGINFEKSPIIANAEKEIEGYLCKCDGLVQAQIFFTEAIHEACKVEKLDFSVLSRIANKSSEKVIAAVHANHTKIDEIRAEIREAQKVMREGN